MGFLRRIFGGSQPAQSARSDTRRRQGLTPAHAVVPVPLDPTWPVVPTRRIVRGLSTDEKNALPYEATVCPSCGVTIASPPKGRKKCASCGAYMFVRVIDNDRRRLVTETDAAVIDLSDAERRGAEWDDSEREWYAGLAAAGVILDDTPEEGGQELSVTGESHYHAHLAGLMASLRVSPDDREVWAVALLVRDPQNKHDRNAVRVAIHGGTVGYLSRDDAADIQQWMKKFERQQRPVYVLANVGGGRTIDGEVGPIGVTLVDLPEDVLD